jgi:hypothetical protein
MAGVLEDYAENANLAGMAGPIGGPTKLEVSDKSLVSNQLSSLLNSDSPYLQRARARATEYANSRGLLNSSIAATAGEAAAIDASLPVAQSDAETYGRADEFNATQANAFTRDANSFGREGALTKYQGVLAQQTQQRGIDAQRELQAAELGSRERTSAAELTSREKLGLADIDIRREQLAQSATTSANDLTLRQQQLALEQGRLSAQEAEAQRQAQLNLSTQVAEIRQQAIVARANIENNPNLSAEGKANAIIALSQQATQDVIEFVRLSGLTLPDAWPEWINEMVPTAAAPAPATPQNSTTNPSTGLPWGWVDQWGPGGGP